jgi:penicillin-insensitive murein endopeptidase
MMKLFMLLALCLSEVSMASEAKGYYSNGTLNEADSILTRKTAIHKLFLQRKKNFTTDEMHEVISNAADFIKHEFPTAEFLQVGDLSSEKGGPAPGHGSHQNGLDIDVVYLTRDGKLQSQNAPFWEEEFITSKSEVSLNFHTERNLMLFKHLVTTEPVGRIFVDKVIKKHLCQFAEKSGLISDVKIKETLRRLRPEALHTNHFHMRITCPPDDRDCTSQSEVPAGTGCDQLTMILEEAVASRDGC